MARQSKLDKEIEKLYYANCQGTSIDIMNISKLFKESADAHAEGKDLEQAVIEAIAKYNEAA